MTIGEMVLQYRKEHNMSQRQFALKCGLSNAYINMLEKNTNPCTGNPISISVETAGAIASAMGLSASELLELADSSTLVSDVSDNKLAIGQNIRKYRQLRSMSQAQLAEEIDCSQSAITMYETGKREPDMDTIEAIAKALNISNHKLIPENDVVLQTDNKLWKQEFANRLRKSLESSCMSASDLSNATGIGKSDISNYTYGKYMPKQDRVLLMARALGVDPAWLSAVDIKYCANETDETTDAILLGIAKLSQEDRQKLLDMARVMFPDAFPE